MPIDTFTDTAGTLLTAHTPAPGGGAWTTRVGNTPVITSDGQRVRPAGTARTAVTHDLTPPSDLYSVFGKVRANTTSGNAHDKGVIGRHQGATDSYYFFLARMTGTLRLGKYTGGVFTLIQAVSFTFTNGQDYDIELRLSSDPGGLKVEGWLAGEGTPRCTGVDATPITGAGLAGLTCDGDVAVDDSVAPSLDDYTTSFYSETPPQTLTPDADVDAGGWTGEGGETSGLAAKLADSNDATYIRAPANPASATYKTGLSNPTQVPGAGDYVVKFRHRQE